jgi:hypothetical protein
MAGAAATSGAGELQADSLLLRRPHYELHGDVLCYPEVQQPLSS